LPAAYLIHSDPKSGYRQTDAMAQYSESVRTIVESFGGTYHLRHKAARVLEGTWAPEFVTLIQFPTMTRLLEFYESDEYRPWRDARAEAGDGNIVVVEDGDPD
jgi:uncharacterized protein (DUF1330 family)